MLVAIKTVPLPCSQEHTIRCFPEPSKLSPQFEAIFKQPFLNIVVHCVRDTEVTDFEGNYAVHVSSPTIEVVLRLSTWEITVNIRILRYQII